MQSHEFCRSVLPRRWVIVMGDGDGDGDHETSSDRFQRFEFVGWELINRRDDDGIPW